MFALNNNVGGSNNTAIGDRALLNNWRRLQHGRHYCRRAALMAARPVTGLHTRSTRPAANPGGYSIFRKWLAIRYPEKLNFLFLRCLV
ncbi:MAG TPA: hypothetical protein VFA61_04540 [Candidatus Udaeobacter sp.]|nr:hypothetical protein [Candidatus Udaeobacter sp.]